jgi:predicted alpha-1,2-mannosidase
MKALSLHFFSYLFLLVNSLFAQTNYSSYVNPFIGTGGHGHTFPGAVLPFGMVQLSPDTRVDGSWDGCSGYHFGDDRIYGFSHTHLSGTGCSDWGDILIMPTVGVPSIDNNVYSSTFSHKNEKASPGYYEVVLNNNHIKAELTVTPRVGIHRYTFPASAEANIILDLLHRDKTLDCGLHILDSVTVIGYRISEAWAKNQHVYFSMKFSKPFKNSQLASNRQFKRKLGKFKERSEGACFTFEMKQGEQLLVKVALSPVSVEGAQRNMYEEAFDWNFEKYKTTAAEQWNNQLKKIEISKAPKDKLTVFYTALYHCSIHPSLNMDIDSMYRGSDNKIHKAKGFTNYTVFSLWDTYRGLHPLLTILEPKRTGDFINSFLNHYKFSGRLPVWELSSNETNCMIGFHSVSVIADAVQKGIEGFDLNDAYTAAKAASEYTAYGIPEFNKKGFLQVDDESESVSKSLEYAYDNWCIAQMAAKLNKPADVKLHLKRSLAYKNLFDSVSGCMRPRKNGNWLTPFYPSEINNYFTEGNSWQYSFYVPHDINGLIKLHGGKENFDKKLDELFTTNETNKGRQQADVTGLIGQYAHGNEPSHHMAYLYNYVGKPQKTVDRVHYICQNFYTTGPDGLIGNEDCGQMSAWYVFSAMGLYPVCPGSGEYIVSEPIFKSVKINLENGKNFTINCNTVAGQEIQGILIDGKIRTSSSLEHTQLMNGGKMDFVYEASANPKDVYGTMTAGSSVTGVDIIPAPLIKSVGQVFKDKAEISIAPLHSSGSIYYTLDGKEPEKKSKLYQKPFSISANTRVAAKQYTDVDSSGTIEGIFFKIKYDYDIQIKSKAHAQYAAEGAQSLIDGIKADMNWRKGNWLGYQGQDFECVIDMKQPKDVNTISLDCLQDMRSWIIFPASVSFYTSSDNTNFTLFGTASTSVKPEDDKVQVYNFEARAEQLVKARYIKIVAKNFGKLPDWHPGKGGEAYIFTDEIELH